MKYKSIFISVAIFFLSFIWILNFAIRGIDTHHDGIIFIPALDIANGKILLKETFTQYGILTAYIHAFFIEIFGKQLFSVKLATVFFYSLTAVFLWLSTRKLVPDKPAIFTVIIWLILAQYYNHPFYSWPSIYGAFFNLIILYIFIFQHKQYKKMTNTGLFLMGVFSALAFWSKQTFLLLFLSINIYFLFLYLLKIINIKSLKRNIYFLGIGFFTTSLVFLASIILTNSIHDFWLQSIRTAYTSGRIIGNSFNFFDLFLNLLKYPTIFISITAIFYFLTYSLINIKNKKNLQESAFLLGVSFISVASLTRIYPASDVNHIYWALTPIFGITIYFLFLLYKMNLYKNVFIKLFVIFILVAFSTQTFSNLNAANEKLLKYIHPLNYQRITKGFYVTKEQYDLLTDYEKQLDIYFVKNPNKELLLLHSDAMFLTFSERDKRINPFLFNFSGFTSGIYPDYLEKANQILLNEKPLIIQDERYAKNYKNYKILKIYPSISLAILKPEE